MSTKLKTLLESRRLDQIGEDYQKARASLILANVKQQ